VCTALEHAVAVGGRCGNDLQNVPVLDNLAGTVKAKDVDSSVVFISRPMLKAVQHDEVTFSNGPSHLDALSRVLPLHAFEVGDKSGLTISNMRVMLGIRITNIAGDGLSRLTVVEHEGVESNGIGLVLVSAWAHSG
jgi:hypothetical protein